MGGLQTNKDRVKKLKDVRLKHYDYKQDGYYFVTICSDNKIHFTPEHKIVINHYLSIIPENERGVEVDYCMLMPDHLHMILLLNNAKLKLGDIVRRFKARTSKEAGISLWQPSYYEHVIRKDESLNKIREYITNNPLKEKIDFNEM